MKAATRHELYSILLLGDSRTSKTRFANEVNKSLNSSPILEPLASPVLAPLLSVASTVSTHVLSPLESPVLAPLVSPVLAPLAPLLSPVLAPLAPNITPRSIYNKYSYIPTTNIDLYTADLHVNKRDLLLQIWDTPGSYAYHLIISKFISKPFDMIIIMFDDKTIGHLSYWIDLIHTHISQLAPIVLMENYNDEHLYGHTPQQDVDSFINKYSNMSYSINIWGQSAYILKNIIETRFIIKDQSSSNLCCHNRKHDRCCF